jgi:hypothetical protein
MFLHSYGGHSMIQLLAILSPLMYVLAYATVAWIAHACKSEMYAAYVLVTFAALLHLVMELLRVRCLRQTDELERLSDNPSSTK